MYTKEDFFRDYPPVKKHPFAFDWEVEYHEQELERVRKEAQREAREVSERAAKETAKAMLAKGLSLTLISEITKLEEEVIRSLQESPEGVSQKNGTST